MKRVFTFVNVCFLLFSITGYAQNISTQGNNSGITLGRKGEKFQTKWKTNPFDDHVFIQNNGQFDGKIKSGEKILYSAHLGKIDVYFTSNKVVYRYDKYYFQKPADPHQDADDPKNFRHEIHMLSAQWMNANKSVWLETNDEQKNYYTYPDGPKKSIKAGLYKQLVYKNLYPGIDAIYQFIDGQNGIKYSLVVYPGADLSKIKINYSGAKSISKNKQGDILINSEVDLLTEHAPVTSYLAGGNIAFSNAVTGNIESFKAVESYDNSKTIIIDPWQTDPLFTPWDKAYDLDWDYHGNVYAYGGQPTGGPLLLTKMNSAGVIQWTFNSFSGSYYGDIAVDKVTGTTYVTQGLGGEAYKVNTLGALIGTFPGNPNMNEGWRAEYDACNGDIVIAGGGTSGDDQAGILDTNMSSVNPVNIMGVATNCHDNSLMTIDPNGTQCYIASARSLSVDPLHADNVLMKLPLPSLTPTIFEVHENNHFVEVSSITYAGKDIYNESETNAMNGAACSPDWVYLYNGDTVRRYNKITGAYVSGIPISPNTPFEYGGLAVDPCNNLFVGVRDSIYVFDSNYVRQAKVSLSDTIYDLQLGQGTALYACGKGYVTQLINPYPATLISSAVATPSSCSACNGTATVNVNCGISPYEFRWSNGNTNETDTGLCAGVYKVTVTDAACPPHIDSTTVTVTGELGFSASITDTNPDCGLKKGNATVHVIGGHPPYTYLWSNSSTNQEDTGLVAGVYTCIITDNTGCRYLVSVTLVNPTSPTVKVIPDLDSLCLGASVGLTASGARTYSWSPSIGLSCNNCPNPTATPTATTTYTVTGTDSIGCTGAATAKIKVYATPKPIIRGKDSVCSGYTDTLSVTGGTRYVWSNSATTTSINNVTITTQVITVTAYNGPCSHDTSFTIHVVSPAALITASKDSVCTGDSVELIGSGGSTYKWSNGKTTTNIWVNPANTTTYTLYVHSGTCNDSVTKPIRVIPPITATISAINDTVCPHGATTMIATGIGGQTTYKWNTGATTSMIIVNDTVTTTYTATVYGLCDSTKVMNTVLVIPLPLPVINGRPWECHGAKDTLSVSSSTNPTSYLWSNGSTKTTYNITGDINADSTIYVTAENSLGCPVKDSFNIAVRIPPVVRVNTGAVSCGGQPVVLKAKVTGTNAPFTYTWLPAGSGSGDSITVTPDSVETYTVIVSNGCSTTRITTVTPESPAIEACCNTMIIKGNDTTMVASGDTSIVSYSWSPSVDCLDPKCDSVKAKPGVTTTYTVTGTDSKGCQSARIVTITVEIPCFNFVVPNVFTPSNAGAIGLDNNFYINTSNSNVDSWSLLIYDRWGKEMFKSTNPNEYWNGNAESGGLAPAGVYYYIIDGTCQGNTYKKDGFVQLIR